ncbi:hypothetical protein [Pseudomonas sp. NPDC007930]|uniref:hypothetical protein n=1 Tax=Pseudomonas sp. NPDC007930 TaxID=3364417 RepID=UPI0036EF9A1B
MDNETVIRTLQHLIGTPYTPDVKATITELTGRERVVGPNDIATHEFDLNRVRIVADADAIITGFTFG